MILERTKYQKHKKIAILSVCDESNIGNRLQAYALQKNISIMGESSEHIEFSRNDKYFIFNKIFNIFFKFIFFLKNFIIHLFEIKHKSIKFRKDLLIFSKKYISSKKFDNFNSFKSDFFINYKKVIVGSDVIWQIINNYPFELRFLYFLPKAYKFSYAASMGEYKIPTFILNKYIAGLNSFKNLSVREPIDNNLNQKNYFVDLDPTFLLNKAEWVKLIKKPNFIQYGENFNFYFILDTSNINKNKEYISNSDDLCKNIYAVDHDIGPSEFLYLIKNSRFILTDSYHAVIFSIIFRKSFYAINRTDIDNKSSK
jgi:hypothetical protein